jgi:hypothetical protein
MRKQRCTNSCALLYKITATLGLALARNCSASKSLRSACSWANSSTQHTSSSSHSVWCVCIYIHTYIYNISLSLCVCGRVCVCVCVCACAYFLIHFLFVLLHSIYNYICLGQGYNHEGYWYLKTLTTSQRRNNGDREREMERTWTNGLYRFITGSLLLICVLFHLLDTLS